MGGVHYVMMIRLSPFFVVAALGAFTLLSACTRAPQPPAAATDNIAASAYKPSATFQELMDSVVDTSADYVWHSVSTTVDAKGTHETRPQSDADWHGVRQRAIQIVEAANLIAVPGRRVAYDSRTVETNDPLDVANIQQRLDARRDELVGFAGALRDIGSRLVAAADRHDVDALSELGSTLDEVCEACHKVFWYPDQLKPAASEK
jgi:hypothetical protein